MELRGYSFNLFVAMAVLFTAGYLSSTAQAYKFFVGGRDGWVPHPAEDYNHWAGRMRFLINDTLYFKYKKGEDSVLLVTGEDYSNCNTKNPIKKWDDGDTLFQFDRSGPFFFISGKDGNCQQGQKLIVVVLALRYPPPVPVPIPPTTPPTPTSAPPPKGLPPTSVPPPGSTPTGEPPASLPPAPGAYPPGVFPPTMPPAASPSGGEPPASTSPSPGASPPTGLTPTASPTSTPPAPAIVPTAPTVPSTSSPQGAPTKSPPATSFPVTTSPPPPPPPPPPNSDASVSGPTRLWASMVGLGLIVALW